MLIDEAVDYLDLHINRRLTLEKIDGLSLEHMVSLLEAIGDPQRDFPMIHVTGTNGKGSTAAMISGLLNSLGLTVGTYSSPHVSSITELTSSLFGCGFEITLRRSVLLSVLDKPGWEIIAINQIF